jgi:hypothetical protein
MKYLFVCLIAVPDMGSGSGVISRMVKRASAPVAAMAVAVAEPVDESTYGKTPSAPAGPSFSPPPPVRGPSEALWGDRTKELFPAHLFPDVDPTEKFVEKTLIPVAMNTYTIADTDWSVMYVQFCQGRHNSLEREVSLMKEMNVIDPRIARLHVYTSKAIREPVVSSSSETTPKLESDHWRNYPCPQSDRMVRYYITERVDRTLHEILSEYERLPLHLVAHVGIQMMESLSKIHRGGIAFSNGLSLKAIGRVSGSRSGITLVAATKAVLEREGFSLHRSQSIENLLPIVGSGDFIGYIDDVHHLVQLLAILAHGFTLAGDIEPHTYQRNFEARLRTLASEGNYFDLELPMGDSRGSQICHYRITDTIGVIPQHAITIAAILKQVVNLSRSPIGETAAPPYGQICALLKQVADMPYAMHPETIELFTPLYESLGIPLPH